MTDQERARRRNLYRVALIHVELENRYWYANRAKWERWDDDQKDWWIESIEAKAKQGLPMACELITKVTQLRMTG